MRFDVVLARAKHLSWQGRLRCFLEGQGTLTLEEAIDHRKCELGVWLYGEGMRRYGGRPEIVELEGVHERMHTRVRETVELLALGRRDEAEAKIKEVAEASRRVVELLRMLEQWELAA